MKRRLSIIQEGPTRKIRMAHLAIIGTYFLHFSSHQIYPSFSLVYPIIEYFFLTFIGSHMVNGVAALHSFLLTTDLFPEFNEVYIHLFIFIFSQKI